MAGHCLHAVDCHRAWTKLRLVHIRGTRTTPATHGTGTEVPPPRLDVCPRSVFMMPSSKALFDTYGNDRLNGSYD